MELKQRTTECNSNIFSHSAPTDQVNRVPLAARRAADHLAVARNHKHRRIGGPQTQAPARNHNQKQRRHTEWCRLLGRLNLRRKGPRWGDQRRVVARARHSRVAPKLRFAHSRPTEWLF